MNPMCKIVLCVCLFILQACASNPFQQSNNGTDNAQQDTQVLTAEGQAAITQSGILEARKQAIQAAIKNASAQQIGDASVSNTKVVDEWQDGKNYHVQVLTVISETEAPFCISPYKKRIVATGFPIVTSGQISGNESQDLYSGIPREINNLLMESGDFIGRNKTHTVLYTRPDMAPEIIESDFYSGSSIIDIAHETGAQFVLSGVIRDIEVESTEYIRGAGVLAKIKTLFRDVVARRGITLDIYVHDGFTGLLLFQHRYSDSVLGDVWIPAGYSVGSERFNSTPAGHKINKIIHQVSQEIRRIFGCYPFTARVVSVNNNQIVIAAGSQDKIKPGDSLVVFASSAATQNLGSEGTNKEPIGMLKINTVNSMVATGTLELPSNTRRVREGDWVKSW